MSRLRLQFTAADQAYDAERLAKSEVRARLASERGITLTVVEDQLACMQPSNFDRRVARGRLAASRARLGW